MAQLLTPGQSLVYVQVNCVCCVYNTLPEPKQSATCQMLDFHLPVPVVRVFPICADPESLVSSSGSTPGAQAQYTEHVHVQQNEPWDNNCCVNYVMYHCYNEHLFFDYLVRV